MKSLDEWEMKNLSDRVVLKKNDVPFLLPKIEIIVDDSLGFTVKVFGCYLPDDHSVYVEYRRTVRNVAIWKLVKQVEEYKLCSGVTTFELTSKLFHHVIPINEDSLEDGDQNQPFPNKGFWRTMGCFLICEGRICLCCLHRVYGLCKQYQEGQREVLIKTCTCQGTCFQD